MTNPLVGHVLGSHGHMPIFQGHVLEDSLWLLVIDQALSQAQKGVW